MWLVLDEFAECRRGTHQTTELQTNQCMEGTSGEEQGAALIAGMIGQQNLTGQMATGAFSGGAFQDARVGSGFSDMIRRTAGERRVGRDDR